MKRALVSVPLAIASGFTLFLFIPATRDGAKWLLRGEMSPVELLTFAGFMVGGILGLVLAARARRRGESLAIVTFFGVFSLGRLFTGMEEVAWGQWLVGFETPEALRSINRQHEFTLHNIRGLHGHSEYFRLAFGIGGLVGLAAAGVPGLARVAVPRSLWAWVVVVAVLAAIDLYLDLFPANHYVYRTLGFHMSEVNEMLIAMTGCLYTWLKLKGLPGVQPGRGRK